MTKSIFFAFFLSIVVFAQGQTGVSQFSDPTGKYSTTTSGTCIACGFANLSNIADNDLSNSATINIGASVFGASRGIRTKLTSLVPGNTKAGFYINTNSVLSLLPSVNVSTYKAGVFQETIVSNGDLITLLGGTFGNVCGTTSVSKPYDEVEISFNMGTLTVGATLNVYYAFGGFSSCPMTVLPVKFIDVQVNETANNSVTVNCIAEDEGNSRYILQKSNDGKSFSNIDWKISDAQVGRKSIQFTDKQTSEIAYYRIFIDGENTGQPVYSKIVSYRFGTSGESMDVFPNPVSGNQFNLGFHATDGKTYSIRIFDNNGHMLYQNTFINSTDQHSVRLNNKIPAGIYNLSICELHTNKQRGYSKLILVK